MYFPTCVEVCAPIHSQRASSEQASKRLALQIAANSREASVASTRTKLWSPLQPTAGGQGEIFRLTQLPLNLREAWILRRHFCKGLLAAESSACLIISLSSSMIFWDCKVRWSLPSKSLKSLRVTSSHWPRWSLRPNSHRGTNCRPRKRPLNENWIMQNRRVRQELNPLDFLKIITSLRQTQQSQIGGESESPQEFQTDKAPSSVDYELLNTNIFLRSHFNFTLQTAHLSPTRGMASLISFREKCTPALQGHPRRFLKGSSFLEAQFIQFPLSQGIIASMILWSEMWAAKVRHLQSSANSQLT